MNVDGVELPMKRYWLQHIVNCGSGEVMVEVEKAVENQEWSKMEHVARKVKEFLSRVEV